MSIDRLIAELGEATGVLAADTIAEALWLAAYLPAEAPPAQRSPPDPAGAEEPAGSVERSPRGFGGRERPETPSRQARPSTPGGDARMYLATGEPDASDADTVSAGSPAVNALPHTLALGRALRPLRRAVPAGSAEELDEKRTAELTAEAHSLQIAFTESRDSWLDLTLIMDESPSMVVWDSTITELMALARRVNAFGRVRLWRMAPDPAGRGPRLCSGRSQVARPPWELIDARGRQLILIFSDCVSAMWESAELREWLASWGRAGPIAIVQPLPQRLWHRCRPDLHLVTLHPPYAGAPMSMMRPQSRDATITVPAGAVAIPVIELTAPWLHTAATLVTGRNAEPVNAVALLTEDPPELRFLAAEADLDDAEDDADGELTGAEQVQVFRAGASANARNLADFLAAAPLTLPVMRLVQRLMLPDSLPQDLAEVFVSGLLERSTPEGRPTPADQVVYDFRKDVRQVLLTGLRAGEAIELLDTVSHFINQRMGTSFDFPALLAGQDPGPAAGELGQPFAAVARDVLMSLGGRFAELADRLLPAAEFGGGSDQDIGPERHPGLTAGRHKGEDVSPRIEDPPGEGQGTAVSRPAIWGEVPPRNPDFTGRGAILRTLRRQLTNRATALLPHTLHGLGGVGKTQLAVEYAYRYQSAYELVWWVPAEQPALMRQSLADLARRLNLVQSGEIEMGRALSAVYDALRTGRPYSKWLLVFDNATRPEDLFPFLSNPGGHLLITSRNYNWSGIAQTVEVDVFNRPESVELLTRRMPELTAARADQLAELLGDLPLALEQAASWINATAMPVEEYADLLEKRIGAAMAEGTSASYEASVATVFGLAFDRLAEQNPPALQVLQLCAFFGAEPISLRLLPMGRYARDLPGVLDATLRDDLRLRRAVRDIGRFGVAKVDATRNSLQVHRLVQAILRERLSAEQRAAYRTSVQEILAAYNPGDPTDDPKIWDRHAEIGPHVEESRAVDSDDPNIRNVVLDQIRYLYVSGDYVSSRELGQVAYDKWRDRLGEDSELVIVTARFLGNAMRSTGMTAATRELNVRTLEVARRALGDRHEHTLAIENSVGGDLRMAGDWTASRELDEGLLRRHREVFGEDDPNTLRVANNLGVDLRLLGDFQTAYQLDLDTWNRRRRILGDDHPDTLFSVTTGVSRDLYGLGRYGEAIELQGRWLDVLRRRLGSDHANVLLASRIHAASLRKAGLAHEALQLSREVVRRRREGYGEEHTETISAMLTLFTVLARVDRLAEAKAVGEDTLAGYRRVVGEHHTFTYVGMTDLAIVLRMAGDFMRAREHDQAALTGLRNIPALGQDHPYTICTAINMSNNLAAARDHTGARRLLSDTLPRAQRVLGDNHPETLACAANLALDLSALGERDEARRLREETLNRFREVLRDDSHPDIDDLVHERRLYCVVDPPPT